MFSTSTGMGTAARASSTQAAQSRRIRAPASWDAAVPSNMSVKRLPVDLSCSDTARFLEIEHFQLPAILGHQEGGLAERINAAWTVAGAAGQSIPPGQSKSVSG